MYLVNTWFLEHCEIKEKFITRAKTRFTLDTLFRVCSIFKRHSTFPRWIPRMYLAYAALALLIYYALTYKIVSIVELNAFSPYLFLLSQGRYYNLKWYKYLFQCLVVCKCPHMDYDSIYKIGHLDSLWDFCNFCHNSAAFDYDCLQPQLFL